MIPIHWCQSTGTMLHLYRSPCDFYIFLALENVEVYGTKQPINQPGHGPNMADSPSTELMLTARLAGKTQVFSLNRCDANFKSLVCGTKKSTAPQAGWEVEMEGCLLKMLVASCCKETHWLWLKTKQDESNPPGKESISHLWKRKIIRIQLLSKGIVLVCLVEVLRRLTMGYHASMSTGHNGVALKCMKSCNFG